MDATLLQTLGVPVGGCVLILIAGWRKFWVFGWYATFMEKRIETLEVENAVYRDKMFEAQAALAALAGTTERVVRRVPPTQR